MKAAGKFDGAVEGSPGVDNVGYPCTGAAGIGRVVGGERWAGTGAQPERCGDGEEEPPEAYGEEHDAEGEIEGEVGGLEGE